MSAQDAFPVYLKDSYTKIINRIINDYLKTDSGKKSKGAWLQVDEIEDNKNFLVDISSYYLSDYIMSTYDLVSGNCNNIEFLPTNFIEKSGKLFLWNDPRISFSDDIINIMFKYDFINPQFQNIDDNSGYLCDRYYIVINGKIIKKD